MRLMEASTIEGLRVSAAFLQRGEKRLHDADLSGFLCIFASCATRFLGTASGEFPRPAASRLLLSRFLPKKTRVPPIKQPLALGAVSTRPWMPLENGEQKEKQNAQCNSDHR